MSDTTPEDTSTYPPEDSWSQAAVVFRNGWMQVGLIAFFLLILTIGHFFASTSSYSDVIAEEYEEIEREKKAKQKQAQEEKDVEEKRYVE